MTQKQKAKAYLNRLKEKKKDRDTLNTNEKIAVFVAEWFSELPPKAQEGLKLILKRLGKNT